MHNDLTDLTKHAQLQQEAARLHGLPPLDPGTLTFTRSEYPFTPSNVNGLLVKENESAVLTLQSTMEGSGSGPVWGGRGRVVEGLHARGSRRLVPKNGAEAQGGGAEEI